MGKRELRREIFAATARRHRLPLIYVNQVGGNDQLVFDGSSFAMNCAGRGDRVRRARSKKTWSLSIPKPARATAARISRTRREAVYQALVLGTRDYIRKCGFRKVLIGLSGGIDSSLTAAIAVDAVGAENVTGVGMPGPYSSDRQRRRRPRDGRKARHPLRNRSHHRRLSGDARGSRSGFRRSARATSPKRTSSPGSAASR